MAEVRRFRGLRFRKSAVVALVCLIPPATLAAAAQEQRQEGDAKVFATVPTPPGFPEGIAVRRDKLYVAGPATFGTTKKPPSAVVEFDRRTSRVSRIYETQGEDLDREHANSSIAFDAEGRLYVLNTQLGIYRLDPESGKQHAYSEPFPDLRPCPAKALEPFLGQCSPTLVDAPPIPNDIVFDAAGYAYVTDSTQATIWRVPPAHEPSTKARKPVAWFQHRALASEYIGVNGIRLSPDRKHLFITVSTDLAGRSWVYKLSLATQELTPFHEYLPGELPDGVAFGKSGKLYVAIANPLFSGVSILSPNKPGTDKEVKRFRNPGHSPAVPYDSPANIAFDGKGSIMLTNHAFVTGAADPSRFTVLDVFVNDTASPLEQPQL